MPAIVDVEALSFRRRAAVLAADDGRLPEAENSLTEVVDALADVPSPMARRALADTLTDRAWVRQLSNRWVESLADLDRAMALIDTMPVLVRRSVGFRALVRRARLRARRGSPVEDVDAAERDAAAARAAGFSGFDADTLDCTIAIAGRDWASVATLSARGGERMAEEGFPAGAAAMRLQAARALVELGQWEAAAGSLPSALEHLERLGPPDLLSEALLTAARIDSHRGRHEEAWATVERSLALAESLVRHFRELTDQHRFVSDKLQQYGHAFAIARAPGTPAGLVRAWGIAERAKGFYLRQLVANAEVPLFDGIDPEGLAGLRALEDALDHAEYRLAHADAGAPAEALVADVQRLSAERDAVYSAAMRDNPRWAALRTPPALDMAALLARLDGQHAVLSLFLEPQGEGALVHTFFAAHGIREHRALDITGDDLERLNRVRADLERVGAGDPFLPALPHEICARLMPAAWIRALDPGRPLLVSAHGVFAALALHATRLEDGRRLIECCPVQYVPTLALLDLPAATGDGVTRAQPGTDLLLIGCAQDGFGSPPLPDVPAEIEELAPPWRAAGARLVSTIIGPDETPSARGCGLPAWSDARRVHVACHGTFTAERPLDAALLLGRDKLRAAEFFGVRLCADVVILSACDVGRRADALDGIATGFDEWLGLYLPLFYAGARTLVASRWQANSAKARQFMRALHASLAAGRPPAFAFRDACLALARSPEAFWANWLLAGLPDEGPSPC